MGDRWHGALDIGGTKTGIGLVKNGLEVAAQARISSRTENPEEQLGRIRDILEKQCREAGISLPELEGIGAVCAGPVDPVKGTMENPYTLPGWESYPLTAALERVLSIPAKLENDANGALLGEVRLQGLEHKRVMMITFGTGIGAAFWNGEALYRTGRRYHPELGHIIVGGAGDGCYCGRRGCMESLLSGTALHKRAGLAGYEDFMQAVGAAGRKDAAAVELLKDVRRNLQNALWNFSLLFQPDYYLFGGGMGEACFGLLSSMAAGMDMPEDFIYPFQVLKGSSDVNPALVGGANLWGYFY